MQREDHQYVDRRPWQVEDRVNAGPGDELAECVKVAQDLAARPAERGRPVDNGGDDPSRHEAVEANAGPGQDPRPHRVETGERDQSNQQHDGQHQQGDLAGARDHPVIDLQHVERGCEVEQVDRQAEHQRGREIPAAGVQDASQFVRLGYSCHFENPSSAQGPTGRAAMGGRRSAPPRFTSVPGSSLRRGFLGPARSADPRDRCSSGTLLR